jgi:diaminopimelate dehydrogenase
MGFHFFKAPALHGGIQMAYRIGIFGYGNLGRGVEAAVKAAPDMSLEAIFTRRDPSAVKSATGVKVLGESELSSYEDRLDVLVLCGGSATDLPVQTPALASRFNVVDSFDTHARIPEQFKKVDAAAKKGNRTAVISTGWDPGLFSVARAYSEAVLPDGKNYTFWGRGVSQGHSDAIRRIKGVKDARQYTVPREEALEAARSGKRPELTARQMHLRECWVVPEEGADLKRIENEIKTMPNYFADYDTTVNFITEEELQAKHAGLPHGGFVLRSGKTGLAGTTDALIEYRLKLGSNPEFTGGVLAACARACARFSAEGRTGCLTMLDIPAAYLSPLSREDLIAHLL